MNSLYSKQCQVTKPKAKSVTSFVSWPISIISCKHPQNRGLPRAKTGKFSLSPAFFTLSVSIVPRVGHDLQVTLLLNKQDDIDQLNQLNRIFYIWTQLVPFKVPQMSSTCKSCFFKVARPTPSFYGKDDLETGFSWICFSMVHRH